MGDNDLRQNVSHLFFYAGFLGMAGFLIMGVSYSLFLCAWSLTFAGFALNAISLR